ncbi:MAG: hypothetical protein AAF990_23880 [Bacteroidota bacterium]
MLSSYLKFIPLLLLIVACQSKSQEEETASSGPVSPNPFTQVNFLQSFMDLPDAGLIWGDRIGKIVTKNRQGTKLDLDIVLQNSDVLSMEGWVSQRKYNGFIGPIASFRYRFNGDGSGFGQSSNGLNMYMIPGKLSDQEEVLEFYDRLGISDLADEVILNVDLQTNRTEAVYWYELEDYIEVSYILPIGEVHPRLGLQPRIRTLFFRKVDGQWSGIEEFSKYE